MNKAQYLSVCMRQSKAWLCSIAKAYDDGTLEPHGMRHIHREIIGIAIRRKP